MKNVDLTLTSEEVRTIMKLLDDEGSRLFREGDKEGWQRMSEIRGSIMVSIYNHALEE